MLREALGHWWDDWVGQAGLSLVWAGCWATLVLGPPATFAVYALQSQYVRGDRPALSTLTVFARQYWWKSWLWMAANLVVGAALIANWQFYGQVEAGWAAGVRLLIEALGAVWLLVQGYALPFFVLQERASLRLAWRNGLFTVLAAPGYTLVLGVAAAVVAVVGTVTIIPLLLGGFAFLALLGCQAVQERVRLYRLLAQKNQADSH